ncbi:MAG: protein translocase subunit SecF [Dehalococcoidia bacterium]|nr:protein translocase subunit SecF [Dehalococcoidia bacterium]
MFDFVGKRRWYFLISGLIIIIGIIFLIPAGPFGLEWGIEFTSGSMMTFRFDQEVTQAELQKEMASLGHSEAIIQRAEAGDFLVRTSKLAEEVEDPETGEVMTEDEAIRRALEQRFGPVEILSSYDISPSMARGIASNAAIAVAIAGVGILLYIAWAFRRVMRPFRFGVCAIVALAHDVLIVLGVYAFLGSFFLMEVDAMFITGVLTVVGYSVHDTIVVFDRIRENRARSVGSSLETIVNNSIIETLGRSLNTSLTILFVLLAMFLFGGATIHNFVLVLLIGITVGTYSSICIASPLLVAWERGELGRLFRRIMPRRVPVRGG